MRQRADNGAISVHAIAGCHTVMLGLDARRPAAKGLMGFGIYRTDHTENEEYWLKGFKIFEHETGQYPPGQMVSTRDHPIQGFFWGDYTCKPDHTYTYRVVPLYGTPKKLIEKQDVNVTITTESVDDGEHAVFFNRGVSCAQAFSRKFPGLNLRKKYTDSKTKQKVQEAYTWLSRGLEEGLLNYISKARGERYSLRAAVYEFTHLPVLKAFKAAASSGADVKIIFDARGLDKPKTYGKTKPAFAAMKAIKKVEIQKLMIPRTKGVSYISHNKFIVLLEDGQPIEVWTGSTNMTASGIYGQSNVGHIIRNTAVAAAYYEYWQRLAENPDVQTFRRQNDEANPTPDDSPPRGVTTIFSPRDRMWKTSSKKPPTTLKWYAGCMNAARTGVCFTAAFGVNPALAEVLGKDREFLRFVLLEKTGDNIKQITQDKDVRVSIGTTLPSGGVERMLNEWLTGLNQHVKYIHTKYMLIDPLDEDPITISGSANFSTASTVHNDENMIIDHGDTRLADCYLTEFHRLFNHYYFRNVVQRMSLKPESSRRKSTYLVPDDSWTKQWYDTDSLKYKERLLFRGRKVSGKGISFFDIDETIFHTTAKVGVIKNNQVIRRLTNQEFNEYKLQEGESFDFSEFRDATLFMKKSKVKRPILAKLKAMHKNAKRTGSTIALLTARGTFPDMETFKLAFRRFGIDIKGIDINFAGDISAKVGGTAEAKKTIIKSYLASNRYKRARMYDDNMTNLRSFLSIKQEVPSVNFQAFLVNEDGKTRTIKS